jgi:ubiquinone/menaquinone biosynthesis C-methylase UbiE
MPSAQLYDTIGATYAAPCVAAAAESLPFEDQSFDAAMAFA